jgi:hypothetical protein
MRKMSKYKKRILIRKVVRLSIIVGAALLFSILAMIIVSLLDKPIESYYPHDEGRLESIFNYNNLENVYNSYFVCSNT